MSSSCKLFIPNSSYTVSDVPALLKAAGGAAISAVPYKPPFRSGSRESDNTYLNLQVTKDGKKPVQIDVVQRHIDLSQEPAPEFYGITEESEPPEFAKGITLYSNAFNPNSENAWVIDLMKSVWEKQGGYMLENDGESDDFVFKTGTDPVLSPVARSRDIADMWTAKLSLAMKSELQAVLPPDDVKQLEEGFNELASSIILSALDKKREQQIELALSVAPEKAAKEKGPQPG